VVGDVAAADASALTEHLSTVGVGVELVSHEGYGAPYVTSLLPKPPESWSSSQHTLELVFRPSFSPEVVIRLCSDGETSRLQLASLGTNIWVRRFNPPPWLRPKSRRVVLRGPGAIEQEPTVAPEVPHAETVDASGCHPLIELGLRLPRPAPSAGIDGMKVTLIARDQSGEITRELWSPRPEDPAFELLMRVHGVASMHLSDPESRRRLDELHQAIGLGFPMDDLGGTPRVVRLWGRLSVADDGPLRAILTELSASGGVLDLSEVTGFAGALFDAFDEAGSRVRFVVTKSWIAEGMSRTRVASDAIYEDRARALASVR